MPHEPARLTSPATRRTMMRSLMPRPILAKPFIKSELLPFSGISIHWTPVPISTPADGHLKDTLSSSFLFLDLSRIRVDFQISTNETMAENLADQSEPSATAAPSLSEMFARVTSRFSSNLSDTFNRYSAVDYVRLIAIVGGYLLLRPYLEKLGAKYQERDHARQVDENEESSMAATGSKARVVTGDDEDEDDSSDDDNGDVSWSKKSRMRAKAEKLRKKKEIEARLQAEEDEEDKDIQEFLHD